MIVRRNIIKAVSAAMFVCLISAALASCGVTAQGTPSGATETASPVATPSETMLPSPTETATATETPEATATETTEPAQNLEEVDFQNVHFDYDSSVLGSATPREVPEERPENAPAFAMTPKHIEVGFPDFPVTENTFGPAVRVYRMSDYQALAPELVDREVKYLKILLESRPDLSIVFPLSGVLQGGEPDQGYGPNPPFLPLVNAASDMRVKMEYIDFQNGNGIRYVTHFGQGPSPIEKEGVFYTYQGLTNDGQYWVSATFPVGSSAAYPVPPTGGENNLDQIQSFNRDVAAMFDQLDPQSYIPSLVDLDNLIRSIRVDAAQ